MNHIGSSAGILGLMEQAFEAQDAHRVKQRFRAAYQPQEGDDADRFPGLLHGLSQLSLRMGWRRLGGSVWERRSACMSA